MRQVRVIAAAGLAFGLAVVGFTATATARARVKSTDFYAPPSPLPKQPPGTIIRTAPIDAPAGAKSWRVLYHSRAVDGRDIAVSGVVVAPTGTAPKGGRTVVTWAHGTTGLADQCAPSKSATAATQIPLVDDLIKDGYVVVATDYEGLGTPGVHPYLVGQSEGRSVLDAARAAKALAATDAGDQVLVAGHSQGGQAALFAGELAHSYAPQLHVLGVAAAAPAADVEQILPLAGSISGGGGYLAMGIQGFHAAYPDADPASVLTPDALAKSDVATTSCAGAVMSAFKGLTEPLVLANDPLQIAALQQLLHENSAGNEPAGAPLLIVQGSADTTIPHVLTDAFAKKACAEGDTVDYRVYAGATHGSVIVAAANDIVSWLDDRTAGKPVPSTCS
jgi:alpha-beta hydrolase superfamily lysophospholipase